MAGAEGIEPSALGFGVAVECKRTNKEPPFQRLYHIFQIKSYAFDALLMIWSFKPNEKSKYKPCSKAYANKKMKCQIDNGKIKNGTK